jgi:purine-binding chemotaxis protein CheW
VLGVINLRGKVVPVFDMHIKLGIPQAEATRNTCVIVVNVGGADRGLVVDCVREVADLRGDEIEPPPAFEDGMPSEHLVGIATAGGHTLLLLALPQFLATNRVAEAPEAPEAPEAAAAEAAAAVEATEAARDDFAA